MDYTPVLQYIQTYWPQIIARPSPTDQGTLIGLPRPYLLPAHSGMFQEMYYWDSYFMALGLVGTEHEALIVDIAENMAYLFKRFGLIPNGSRYYFTSRSQPPFFTQLIWLAHESLARRTPAHEADAWLRQMMALAEQEHETVWLGTEQPHKRQVYRGLSRYFDINFLDDLASCESGWDHTTRCDGRWLGHLPVDLNSILYVRERDFERAAQQLVKVERARLWESRALARQHTMQELMWDESLGFFFDYNFEDERRNLHPSLAGFYPLWAGLATQAQAARVVRDWLPRFEFPGGLATTLVEQKGKQWAYPNGWAPLHWIVVAGLERYGFKDEAARIMRKWCDNNATVFAQTGALWEKYNVVTVGGSEEGGLYGSVKGFGWSNAVFADFARRLG
jgi:alpha,alpha-trehalase